MTWRHELQAFNKAFWKQLSPLAWFFQTLNQCQKWSRYIALRGRGYSVKQANITIMRAKLTPALRWKILWRDNFICYLCGKRYRAADLDVDHVSALGTF